MRRGQSTVETMLLVSVISIAIGAVLIVWSDTVQVNARSLSQFLALELTGNGTENTPEVH
ncbi:MAG: hypothetical protein GY913_03685 [Proteobacteria bacterium]|nr:hypothetical protein [Pseudomonadota bacterium]MCP4916003.1 hypothetical protein [Pseudomonadota bacterium]